MISGPLLFARYALPPNDRGLCGPADNAGLRGYASAGLAGPDLRRLAGQFAGAWPYLQLIATANAIADPLDRRVVEAYWVGNGLLDNVRVAEYGAFLDERFRRRAQCRHTGRRDEHRRRGLREGRPALAGDRRMFSFLL